LAIGSDGRPSSARFVIRSHSSSLMLHHPGLNSHMPLPYVFREFLSSRWKYDVGEVRPWRRRRPFTTETFETAGHYKLFSMNHQMGAELLERSPSSPGPQLLGFTQPIVAWAAVAFGFLRLRVWNTVSSIAWGVFALLKGGVVGDSCGLKVWKRTASLMVVERIVS
jgi:hypothetical protein